MENILSTEWSQLYKPTFWQTKTKYTLVSSGFSLPVVQMGTRENKDIQSTIFNTHNFLSYFNACFVKLSQSSFSQSYTLRLDWHRYEQELLVVLSPSANKIIPASVPWPLLGLQEILTTQANQEVGKKHKGKKILARHYQKSCDGWESPNYIVCPECESKRTLCSYESDWSRLIYTNMEQSPACIVKWENSSTCTLCCYLNNSAINA